MILVVGATGRLGGNIVRLLLAKGKSVRILVRHNSPSVELAKQGLATPAEALIAAGAEPVYGDLRDPASLEAVCQGVETVITTANSILRGGEDNIESVDLNGNRNLVAAAKAAGVRHFIFISALGASPDSPAPFMAAKGQIERELMQSGMDYTILAPMAYMEVWPAMVVGMPIQMGLPVTLVGEARNRTSFISTRDVAAYAVAAVDHPAARNQFLPIGGPEALSYRDAVETFERVLGQPIPVEFVQPGEPVPGLPQGMVDLLGMLNADQIVDSTEIARTFGVIPTTLEEVVRDMIARAAK